jgi:hypothetical protein
MNRSFLTIPVLIAAISGSACATKGFVKERVGDVNDKVETLGKSVEETQERTRQNEGKIGDVDQKAQAAQTAANAAASAAGSANSAAMTADQ